MATLIWTNIGLTASSHHLNQCCLIISIFQWYFFGINFRRDTPATSHYKYLENCILFFKSPRGLWVKFIWLAMMLGRVCRDANHVLCHAYTTNGPWVTVTFINNSVRNPCKTYETQSLTSHYLDQCWPSCITSYCVIGCNELTTVHHQVHRGFNGYIYIYKHI